MNHKQTDIPTGCAEWQDQIPALLELAPEDEVRQAWERHARECGGCSAVLQNERRMQELMAALPEPKPAFIRARVMDRVRRGESPRLVIRAREIVWGFAGSFVGVLLGVWIAGFSPDSFQTVEPAAAYEMTLSEMGTGLDDLLYTIEQQEEQK